MWDHVGLVRDERGLRHTLSELAILRVGHVYGAAYEVHHHENIARWVGLADAAIAAATRSTDDLPDEDAAILSWTDRLLVNHTLNDADRKEALELLTVNQLADLVITVGFYQLIAQQLRLFRVPAPAGPW